jgi:hypothetical protein
MMKTASKTNQLVTIFSKGMHAFYEALRRSNENAALRAVMSASPELRKEMLSLHVHCPSNF